VADDGECGVTEAGHEVNELRRHLAFGVALASWSASGCVGGTVPTEVRSDDAVAPGEGRATADQQT
jgi:hypothetical protein